MPFSQNVARQHHQGDELPVGCYGAGYLGIQGNQVPSIQAASYQNNRKPGAIWSPKGLFLVKLSSPSSTVYKWVVKVIIFPCFQLFFLINLKTGF